VELKANKFFNLKETIIFIIVFVTLFAVFFSKSILISAIKNEKKFSPQAVFYIEKLNSILKDPEINKVLINAYLQTGKYQKALKLLDGQKESFETLKQKTEIYKKLYIKKKQDI